MSDASEARSEPKASEGRAPARAGEARSGPELQRSSAKASEGPEDRPAPALAGRPAARTAIRASGAALAAIAAIWAFAVAGAPVDALQGPIQKILYVHVPAA